MGRRAAAAAEALVTSLRDPRLAPAAVTALGAIGARAERGRIESLLEDRRVDMDLRTACARALGALGDTDAAPALQRVFDTDEPQDLDQAIARALVELRRGEPVVPFLVECLTSPLADSGGAEVALETWLAQRAESDEQAAETLIRWRELAPPAGTIETSAQADERRASRAEMLRPLAAAPR
jgi:HEAT repeat protein